MKIEASTVTKLKISGGESLDPVTVFLENFEPGKGKITIECYGKSWSAYWGGMSGDSVEVFFCRCGEHYLAGNLDPRLDSNIPDFDQIQKDIQAGICRKRRAGELDKFEARMQFDDAPVFESTQECWHSGHASMKTAYGEYWWECSIPEKPNPDYQYLCRIIKAVQQGLRLHFADKAA